MGTTIDDQSLATAEGNARVLAERRYHERVQDWHNRHPDATVLKEGVSIDLNVRYRIDYKNILKEELEKMAKEPVKETAQEPVTTKKPRKKRAPKKVAPVTAKVTDKAVKEPVKKAGPEIQEIDIVPILLPILDTPDYSEYATGMLNLGYSIYNAGVRTRALILTNCYRVGFVKAFNVGMGRILSETCWNTPDHIKYTFKYVCLLSADLCHEQKGWLKRLVEVADSDETFGIVSPGKLCGTAPQKFGKPGMPQGYKDVRHITLDGGIIRRELLEQVGLMNELYYHYAADYELVHLAQEAGWKTIYVQDVFAEHDWNPDAIPEWVEHDRPLYYKRWNKKGKRIGIWGKEKVAK